MSGRPIRQAAQVQVRLVAPASLTADETAAWRRLAECAAEPNPFFDPRFVPAAVSALEAPAVRLLVAERDGRWIGAMPIELRRVARVPLLAATWRHPYSFLGTPLADADDVEEFAAALVASLGRREHFRALLFRDASAGPVLEAILAAARSSARIRPVFERDFERGVYRGRPPGEELSWLNSKRRSNLRRQRRQLEEQVGEIAVTDRADTEDAMAAFLRLEASGWKGQGGTALASDSGSDSLFRTLCSEFGADGRLRFRSLEAAGRPIAMSCEIAAGDTLFGFKSAYDEGLSKFSPGLQLYVENFTAFDDAPAWQLFDSCADPDNTTINSLWPDRRAMKTVALGRRGIEGSALARLLERAYRTPEPDA
jgi:CelD/BcsL family acetyltransferase involved in cellulose biosynthesis